MRFSVGPKKFFDPGIVDYNGSYKKIFNFMHTSTFYLSAVGKINKIYEKMDLSVNTVYSILIDIFTDHYLQMNKTLWTFCN